MRRCILGRETGPLTVPERGAVKVVVTLVRAVSSADDEEVEKAVDGEEGEEGVEEEGEAGVEEEEEEGGTGPGVKRVKRVPPVGSKRAAANRAKELTSMDKLMSKQDKRNDIAGITPKAGGSLSASTRPT